MKSTGKVSLWMGMLAVMAVAGTGHTQSEPKEGGFHGWPPGWVESYQRFENFIQARKAHWPSSGLEISPQGDLTHAVRFAESHTEHLSLTLFRRGSGVRSLKINRPVFSGSDDSWATPGVYAITLYGSTRVGYQHFFPILWIEVQEFSGSELEGGSKVRERKLQMIDAPAPGEDAWPNERMLLFLDFHIFPRAFPDQITEENRKVNPVVLLRLNREGVIERDRLADENAERLLEWRVYHDGTLIKNDSANGVTRLESPRAVGIYQVFAGVEGPNGFMPVSNLVEYPLFPQPGGNLAVIPQDKNGDGTPDFLDEIMAKYPQQQPDDREAPLAEADYRLLELWRAWEYNLKNRPPVWSERSSEK